MTLLPTAGFSSSNERKEGEMKQLFEDLLAVLREMPGGNSELELTISKGSVKPTRVLHTIDTERDAPAGSLFTIDTANHPEGRLLLIRAQDPARVVTVKNLAKGAGKVELKGGADVVLATDEWLWLVRVGTRWLQVTDMTTELLGGSAESELTIASGSIRPTRAVHSIDTEADAPADALTHIDTANHAEGRLLLIRAENADRAVTVKHVAGGAGEISLKSGGDVTLTITAWLWLIRVGKRWLQVLDPDAGAAVLGQCRLVFVGLKELRLDRFNGSKLFINGVNETIPPAGVTVTNASLAAHTTYRFYAAMSGSKMTLEPSTAPRATDPTHGHEIKAGDPARTLVGIARTDRNAQFNDSEQLRNVASYYNRIMKSGSFTLRNPINVTSPPWIELTPAGRVEFVTFGDHDVLVHRGCTVSVNGNSVVAYSGVGLDGTGPQTAINYGEHYAGQQFPLGASGVFAGVTEGHHFITGLAGEDARSTATYYGIYNYWIGAFLQ